jgi:cysteinyl-tRNA synthetase
MSSEYENLLVVLKLFQNRPHHLTKFLIENKALNSDFLSKISDSDKLSDMAKNGIKDNYLHFNTISEMKKYYLSLVDDLENLKRKKTKEELSEELNQKLKEAIESENYEEASRIRDYMKLNNIQKL